MHPNNCFITLTYSDENLKSPQLIYADFQKFMKKLRKLQDAPMGVFVTGEYGEKTKRPHWHAIIFNWEPNDKKPKYKTERGDQVYDSVLLTNLWGHGLAEFGSVTFHSAGYCARYAAKKLVHGKDNEHDFVPISKKSSKNAIGKKWLEQFWPDVFLHGKLILKDGTQTAIPRYYEKWLKEHKPLEWERYVTKTKLAITEKASASAQLLQTQWEKDFWLRPHSKTNPLTLSQVKEIIQESKFKLLQTHLKL